MKINRRNLFLSALVFGLVLTFVFFCQRVLTGDYARDAASLYGQAGLAVGSAGSCAASHT